MHIELLEQSEADVIAREDASDGEFFRRADGSVWYRNIDAPESMPVAPDEATFRSAVAALNCYSLAVVRVDPNDDDGQMVLVRQLARDLRDASVLPAPAESFWSLVVEQAEHGML